MQNSDKARLIVSLVINVAIVALEITGTVLTAQTQGWGMLRYYTQDSNLLGMIACAVYAVLTARRLAGRGAIPAWARALKYVATCCLAVTFVVVVTVLAPMSGPQAGLLFVHGSMLYHHLLCPVLAMAVFIFCEGRPQLGLKHTLWPMLPTALYAAISASLNIARVMEGPYPFLMVYEQPWYVSVVWCLTILGAAYLLAWLIWLCNDRLFAGRIKRINGKMGEEA